MNKFIVTCLESVFHVYDARTLNPSKVSMLGCWVAAALEYVCDRECVFLRGACAGRQEQAYHCDSILIQQ